MYLPQSAPFLESGASCVLVNHANLYKLQDVREVAAQNRDALASAVNDDDIFTIGWITTQS